MAESDENKRGHISTTIVAILSLVVAAIASIPAFLSLNKDHAAIYYSVTSSSLQVPDSMDEDAVREILSKNGIPSDTLSISLINQGNSQADEVPISVDLPGKLLTSASRPKSSADPIWVTLPSLDFSDQPEKLRFRVENFGTTKKLDFEFGYQRKGVDTPQVEVFYDGQPAEQVKNVADVSPWSPWQVFKLPLLLLAGGVVLVVIWAIGVVISNNPKLREELGEFLIKVATEVAGGINPFFR